MGSFRTEPCVKIQWSEVISDEITDPYWGSKSWEDFEAFDSIRRKFVVKELVNFEGRLLRKDGFIKFGQRCYRISEW